VDECEKGISLKSRVNGTKADVLRRVFAEAGAGATDFSQRGGSTPFEVLLWLLLKPSSVLFESEIWN
jgi:hypothetical protein